ncbi:hypothetical protein [Natronosalvus vescus]|uniref:hypothetical protein n=1 Tax=Natronosalvus vescus TaxID=2953881 RepID=UPI002090691A|nr:hypothetical protein [Natronosalvus vescus]
MTTATISRWTRRFVASGVIWFVCWQLAAVAGAPRRVGVVLGLFGFVFHIVFGKGYSLIPSYFETQLAFPRAPAVQLPFTVVGTAALALSAAGVDPISSSIAGSTITLGSIGAVLWLAGCLVFVGSIGWTIRNNPIGRETGTSDVNEDRRRVDRLANAAVPLVAVYLLAGAIVTAAHELGHELPFVPSSEPATTHLLAVGAATLLLFAIGFRVLPRFLVVRPRLWLVSVVLPAGAVAPALLVVDFLGTGLFHLGAFLQALAITGFAVAYVDMFHRSDKRRVGFYGVYGGVICGVLAVALGLTFAFDVLSVPGNPFDAHYRLALLGFLGLSIVGVTYQFYPPAIASSSWIDDRTAAISMGLLGVGVLVEASGLIGQSSAIERLGSALVLVGALVYAAILFTVFLERR